MASQPNGPTVQTMETVYNVPQITLPGTIAASGTFVSSVVPTFGMPHVAVAGKMDQAGTLSVQPYLDVAGTIANGAAVTKAMTANTTALIDNVGTVVAQSLTVSIVNTATVAATPASLVAVLASK